MNPKSGRNHSRCGWATGLLAGLVATCCGGGERYEVLRDVVYAQPDHTPLKADIFRPTGQGPFPGVLLVHGGAWAIGNKSQMGAIGGLLALQGFAAVSIDYRLAPQHVYPAQIDDCHAALQWMARESATYKIDPQRIGAWGYSAGGHLVALLATTQAAAKKGDSADAPAVVRAVVAGGAPCDLTTLPLDGRMLAFWLGGTRRELPDRYAEASPVTHVTAADPPMFFYNGQDDRMVPHAGAAAMMQKLQAVGVHVEQYVSPGRDHIMAFLERHAIDKGIAFLDKYLGKP